MPPVLNKATIAPPSQNTMHGIGLVIFMTICFSSLDASAKYFGNELPLWVLLWGRYVFNFLFVALFFFRGAPAEIIHTRNLKMQILRSILLVSSTLTFWLALMFLPLADCVVILFIAPLLVTVLAAPILGESVGRHRWTAVILGFVGVLSSCDPDSPFFPGCQYCPSSQRFYMQGFKFRLESSDGQKVR